MLFAWQVGSKHDAVLGALYVAMALGLELASHSHRTAFTRSGNGASSQRQRSDRGLLAVGY